MTDAYSVKLSIDVPMYWDTKGIKHMRITGPHAPADPDRTLGGPVYKLCQWMKHSPGTDDAPDFYAELDHASMINLRNAISAALFTTDPK